MNMTGNGLRIGLPGVSYLDDDTTVTGDFERSRVLRRWQNNQLIDVFDVGDEPDALAAAHEPGGAPKWVQRWLREWGPTAA
jgi:hypothetical protein